MMQDLPRRLLLLTALLLPTAGAVVWACFPAARALWAINELRPPSLQRGEWDDPARLLDLRRRVQKHFLNHSVYIPMEDIVATSAQDPSATTLALLMQKACGRGRLYIWIPFKFMLPVAGEKVIEWCWKPQTKDA